MTHQLDLMPAELVDESVLERLDARLPKVREVRSPRLPDVLAVVDATGEETFHGEPRTSEDLR
jgi:hypothetical protein